MHTAGENNGGGNLTGEEIVISGISGHFPKSENVTEFMENLYNKVDMVVEVKSEVEHPDLLRHRGKISGVEKFDAQFFKVTYKQAMTLEPMCRKLIEDAYGAIYDSGINPLQMKGKKLGVFIGSSYADGFQPLIYTMKMNNTFIITGYGKTMYANRLSYWIDSKSPSHSVDCTNASSLACVDIAYKSILNGECEAAIIGGCNLCLSYTLSANVKKAGLICTDGKTKCFDKHGDGYVRSDTIGVLFLQKAKDAKRIYAEIYHTKLGYAGFPIDSKPNLLGAGSKDIIKFLNQFYSEIDVLPQDVEYVEANGIAIADFDKNELEAIGEIFCTNDKIIKIGSVTSNMGNSEAASGISALTKVCLAYNRGELSGNLHYNNPHDDVEAVRNGKIKVVEENCTFKRGFAALNSFSFGGASVHVLLKGHYKEKNQEQYKTSIPYLVNVSGRNEPCVERLLDILTNMPIDAEYIGLLHNIYQVDTPGHTCRGYAILGSSNKEQAQVLSKSVEYYHGLKPPVWFMYSGMGSQWCGMGADLMHIPIFSEAIEKCHRVLIAKGVDIVHILTSNDKTIFDDVLNSFVGITAVQIGLTDILRALGITPDYIIGHSTGEMGCAYADGCLTLEETILSAYSRGMVSKQTKFIPGAMAAVGLGYNEIRHLCPPEIDIACHNSANSSTLSGPVEVLREFIEVLKSRGVFAKEVDCGNIAFHSRYIISAGPALLQTLQQIIKHPKPRTSKWMSTSVAQNKWNIDVAKLSSAEYHTNNLLSPVYFEETSRLITNDAIVIEIAPHGLLQAIVKRSHETCIHVPLARRDHSSPMKFLLEALGRLHQHGLNPQLNVLYPKIHYPVATETPLLSNLVGWEHSEHWLGSDEIPIPTTKSERDSHLISLYDDENKYLDGYTRNGVNIVPEAMLLVLTWKTLAISRNVHYKLMSVKLENVYFNSEISFGVNKYVKLKISVNKGDKKFEVTHNDELIANGYIMEVEEEIFNLQVTEEDHGSDIMLNSKEIYRHMEFKGHSFSTEFQSIHSANLTMNKAAIDWTGDWVSYLDALIQLNIIKRNHTGVSQPKMIQKLTINVKKHDTKWFTNESGQRSHEAQILDLYNTIRCGGVTIRNMVFSDKPVVQLLPSALLTKQFSSYFTKDIMKGQPEDHYCTPGCIRADDQNYKLVMKASNDAEVLSWEQISSKSVAMKTIKVSYAGISRKDCEKSIFNNHTRSLGLGMDFSGIDANGARVMGLVANGAVSSVLQGDAEFLWPVPKHWSLQEAATVPLPYVHAFYILSKVAIARGSSVLVTGGAGALGQALISICLSLNYTVYITTSDLRKKQALLRLFPEMEGKNILCDTNHSALCQHLMVNTEGKRCNVVINCAQGELREVGMKCVAFGGTFLDVNVQDMELNKPFGMTYLWECRAYKMVNLSSIFEMNNTVEKQAIKLKIAGGIASGVVKPLISVTYDVDNVSDALKLLSERRNMGRVLLKIGPSCNNKITPRVTCSSEATYVVYCAEHILSLQLMDLLVRRGAKHFNVFWNDSVTGYLLYKIRTWQEMGVTVNLFDNSINEKEFVNVLKQKGMNLEGIFVVLGNIFAEQASAERHKHLSIIASLDSASRTLCKELRYFVVISSRNICDENISLEADDICKRRHEAGFPALVFRVDVLDELERHSNGTKLNIQAQSIAEALTALEISMNLNHYNVLYKKKETIEGAQACKDKSLENGSQISTNGREYTGKQESDGFGVFHSYIGNSVYELTSDPVVTISNKVPQLEDMSQIDSTDAHLIMIPGFEGHHRIFKSFSELLKNSSVAVQLDTDLKSGSIQEMASDIYKLLSQKFSLKTKFYLLGYSFGVNVALELAALIEKEGHQGVVYCVDSSPDALKLQMEKHIGDLSDSHLQNTVAAHLFDIMTGSNNNDLMQELEKIENWYKKIEVFISKVKGKVSHSHEHMRLLLEKNYDRLVHAREYQPSYRLNSELILIKSATDTINLDKDYNLGKYSKKPVKIYEIDADHGSILYNVKVPSVINNTMITY